MAAYKKTLSRRWQQTKCLYDNTRLNQANNRCQIQVSWRFTPFNREHRTLGSVLECLLYNTRQTFQQWQIPQSLSLSTILLSTWRLKKIKSSQQDRTQWRIEFNTTKFTHVTFTTRKHTCPPVKLNNKLPQQETAKYLGVYLDRKLL